MNDARTALLSPVLPETQTDRSTSVGAGLSHTQWLATLKRRDMVHVRNGAHTMPPAMVTDETPCYVFVGKLKFHRRHGWQVQRRAAYQQRLRLVRTEDELT